jgi:hypothetical protein
MSRKDLLLKEHYNKVKVKNNILKPYDNLELFKTTNKTITLSNGPYGRLGNQIIRNLCVSIIAKKFDLHVIYSSYEKIKSLGIDLFSGNNIYNNRIKLTEENFFDILNRDKIDFNLDANDYSFQTKEITNYLYNHLQNQNQNQTVNNSNCFIHIRLGDVSSHNPGIEYYLKALNMITFDKLYIASDDPTHSIIKNIIEKYTEIGIECEILLFDEVKTIQFGSSCRNIILSHGSFSAVIGYLSIGSNVYYPKNRDGHVWYGDMFSIPRWTIVEY